MSLAFFIMAHHKPRQLEALLQEIAPAGDLVLLHVDAKSAVRLRRGGGEVFRVARAAARKWPNVRLMRPRFTNWGGWSLSALHLAAIDQALATDPGWSHFINLSGQCFPLQPMCEIRKRVATLAGAGAVERRSLADLPKGDWHLRWWSMIETPLKAFPIPVRRQPPSGFDLSHKGSQWSILPRSFCEWQRTAPIRRPIRRYLRSLHLTDELVIQALVDNGPWRERMGARLGHDIVWPGHTVTAADIPWLSGSDALFTRKVDFEADPTLEAWMRRRLRDAATVDDGASTPVPAEGFR